MTTAEKIESLLRSGGFTPASSLTDLLTELMDERIAMSPLDRVRKQITKVDSG